MLPALRMQQFLRASRRPVALARRRALAFRSQSAGWNESRKTEWILQQLRVTARHAARSAAYYAELFASVGFDPNADFSFNDFSRLPILEKSDIHSAGDRLLSGAVGSGQRIRMTTGGSTGVPVTVWVGPEDLGWGMAGVERQMESLGAPIGSRTALLWGHNLDPVASDKLVDRLSSFCHNRRWIDCFRLSPEHLDHAHAVLEAYRPDCIVAYASALGALAEHVLERGYKADYPSRCFVTGAEKLDIRHREAVLHTFRRPLHEQYGSRDIGLMAWQPRPESSLDFRVNWENVLIEPETDAENSAILVTKLHADAMPMIRYRIGDEGHFPVGGRPGHPTFQLKEVLGRTTDRVWLPGGRFIHGIQFPHLLKDFLVGEFMAAQREDYSVELQLVPRPGFGPEDKRRIEAALAANLPDIPIAVRMMNTIPHNAAYKWRPVVSEVKQDAKRFEAEYSALTQVPR
ncbi:MAG: hypothetical protein WBM04_01850 [Candidatus Korobacteraceae bacterium]